MSSGTNDTSLTRYKSNSISSLDVDNIQLQIEMAFEPGYDPALELAKFGDLVRFVRPFPRLHGSEREGVLLLLTL